MGNTASTSTSYTVSRQLLIAVAVAAILDICWSMATLILQVRDYSILYWLILHTIVFAKVAGVWLFIMRKQAGWYMLSVLAGYTVCSGLLSAGIALSGAAHGKFFDSIWCFNMFLASGILALLMHPAVRQVFKVNAAKAAAALAGGVIIAMLLLLVHA